jgi:hypothetical protein
MIYMYWSTIDRWQSKHPPGIKDSVMIANGELRVFRYLGNRFEEFDGTEWKELKWV